MGIQAKLAFRITAVAWFVGMGAALLAPPAVALEVVMGEAPTTTLDLTAGALQKARKEILLNIYEMTSPEIGDVLIDRLRNKVKIRILQEGQPVGGLSGKKLQARIVKAMKAARNGSELLEMTSKARPGVKRRFRYDHAKYAVIDNRWLLLGSENYSPTGQARAGTKGNRGWEVRIEDPETVAAYRATFEEDTREEHGDLINKTQPRTALDEGLAEEGSALGNAGPFVPARPEDLPRADAVDVDVILSPTNSFCRIIEAINLASESIDVEQMTFHPGWETPEQVSPVLEALVEAGRRGVKVRVLLNDDKAFGGDPKRITKNDLTVKRLREIAQAEKLPIQARVADVKAMGVTYIHNKGLLVDGRYTLVSSINWNSNSILNNREAALLIEGAQIHAHYSQLFESDWKRSGGPRDEAAQGAFFEIFSELGILP